VLGDHSAETFQPLWNIVDKWKCYFYVTDGWKVYPNFIAEEDQIISKTYMTRVEGENTRRATLSSSFETKKPLLFKIGANAATLNSTTHSLSGLTQEPSERMVF
jgi:hypothetical protein